MIVSPLAGLPAPPALLVDLAHLEHEYYARTPDVASQPVSFGTSGHRGSSLDGTFTETHIVAITQSICDYRAANGIDGPLYMGRDTHALSVPAQRTALEVLAANGVETVVQRRDGVTPTPVISRAVLTYNRARTSGLADGIVITPSHNPPEDGGFKYNGTNGGPADTTVTRWIQDRANALMREGNAGVRRVTFAAALRATTTHEADLVTPYVEDLGSVVDIEAIRASGLRIGIDPLGGASGPYWDAVDSLLGLELTIVNPEVDPTFAFMTVDHDGRIRMDCSSPWAMARLVGLKDRYDIAFANDPDADRHGIVVPGAGLMNPNAFLAVAIDYLTTNRPDWSPDAVVGKTIVSSSLIDRVVARSRRRLYEVPVGFKWFAPGLFDGSCCFGGEESAGASFLRRSGEVWSTDKDGLIMGLLAAEITAVTGRDPGELYGTLTESLGPSFYARIDAPATAAQRARLGRLTPEDVPDLRLAGDAIVTRTTRAPGNDAPIGGLKVTTEGGWFAARPSGTENICKIYAESLRSDAHLRELVSQAQDIVTRVIDQGSAG